MEKDTDILDTNGTSKSTAITNALEKAILAGEYKVGTLLPSQKQLAKKFNVSSRSLREAFKSLETKGLIEVSQGRRAVVKINNLETFIESISKNMFSNVQYDKKLLSDLLHVRISLEVSATRELSRSPNRLVIARTLTNYLEKMNELSAKLEENEKDEETLKEFKKIDFDFHTIIIKSNDNIVLNSIYKNLAPHLAHIMQQLEENTAERKKKLNDYSYLVDALREGQTDLAVAIALVNATNMKNKFEEVYK